MLGKSVRIVGEVGTVALQEARVRIGLRGGERLAFPAAGHGEGSRGREARGRKSKRP